MAWFGSTRCCEAVWGMALYGRLGLVRCVWVVYGALVFGFGKAGTVRFGMSRFVKVCCGSAGTEAKGKEHQ